MALGYGIGQYSDFMFHSQGGRPYIISSLFKLHLHEISHSIIIHIEIIFLISYHSIQFASVL